jgi:hypothetical protein
MLECMGSPVAMVVPKTSLQLRSWLESVVLRSVEARGRVDMLGGRELSTPPAPLKWTYSMMKLSYVGVEPSSTALSHVHPHPSLNTTSCVVRTRCPSVKNAVGLRALHVADEHPRSAPVVELADVAKLLDEREAAEDP